jgi:putative transposase
MFERFSRARLEALLKLRPVSAAGREFIEEALRAPSRNVQGTTRNVAADLPCPKMMGNAQAESWTDEDPFTLRHIFDGQTLGYVNQVPRIELDYRGRNGRRTRTPYTGDCLRFDIDRGVLVEEYKPAEQRDQLEELYPGKFVRLPSGEFTSDAINAVLNPMGIGFALRFSDEVSSIGHRNRKLLHTFLQPHADGFYADKYPQLLAHFEATPSKTFAELLDAGVDIDVLHWAIAHGRLHIDFDAAVLTTDRAAVQVFRDATTLRAWSLAMRPDGSRPSSPQTADYQFSAGDVFLFDGQRLTITIVGVSGLYAIDEKGEHISVPYGLLYSAHRAGKVALPERSRVDGKTGTFWSTSPTALERAIRRVDVIERIDRGETLPAELTYSDRSIRRWRERIREGLAQGMSPVEALIDDGDLKGFHGTHIDPKFSEKLNAWIRKALEDKLAKSIRAMYFDIEKLAKNAGYTMIAKSSFYERVAKAQTIDAIRQAQGHKKAYPLAPAFWMLERTTPVHCERALELVHFDSTLLDIELRSSISGEVLGRPWLSIAVCAHTRRVVGMYLSFRPPSHVSSMMLLADIVKRFGRLPDAIIHDWGSEFKSKDFKYALTALYIKRYVRAKSAPRFGAILERLFGIVTRELIDNIAGNTKLRKNVRQVSPQADPTTHSGLWLADLYEGLEQYFFSEYDTRKHPTTLREPRAMFDASVITYGMAPHRMRRYDEILSILMPTAKGRPRAIDPARGIYVNYRYYGHPLLTDLSLKGESVIVKPIPFDPGSVLAFMKGHWVVCRTGLHEDLRSAPEVVRRCLFEEWMVEQRLVRASHDDSRAKLRELMERLNQKALENKEYFQEREVRRNLQEVTQFPEDAAVLADSSALRQLNTMVADVLRGLFKNGNAVLADEAQA